MALHSKIAVPLVFLLVMTSTAHGAEKDSLKAKQFNYFVAQAHQFAKTKDYEQALELLDKAIAIIPNRIDVRCFKVLCMYETQDNDPEALEEVEKVVTMTDGKNYQTYSLKSWILSRMNRLPEALVAVNKSIDLLNVHCKQNSKESKTPLASLYSDRATIERARGRYREAQKDLTLAINLSSSNQDYFNRRAQVSALMEDWTQVLADTAHVLSSNRPGRIFERRDAFLMRGKAYAALKDTKSATAIYLSANRMCPDDRQLLSEALKFFESVNDKKNAEKMRNILMSVDEDFQPMR